MGIAIRGLCPLIQVYDMPTSLRFYRDILGFAEVEKSGQGDDVGWAWLRFGEAEPCSTPHTTSESGQWCLTLHAPLPTPIRSLCAYIK